MILVHTYYVIIIKNVELLLKRNEEKTQLSWMLSNSQTNLFFLLLSEIGVGLAGFGVAFLFLGMLLLFDKGLLAVGNVGISPFQVVCILFHYSTLSL